jgi:hypothetical protein
MKRGKALLLAPWKRSIGIIYNKLASSEYGAETASDCFTRALKFAPKSRTVKKEFRRFA